jgi:hypothetical protein
MNTNHTIAKNTGSIESISIIGYFNIGSFSLPTSHFQMVGVNTKKFVQERG